jgi:predicted lipoprotein with Yx(FWY)xxD motif
MRSRTIVGLGVSGALMLAACGQSANGSTHSAAPRAAAPTTASTAAVHVQHTALGDVLVNGNGRTLYGFTNDKNGMSSCNGTCAQNWPPLVVAPGWKTASKAPGASLHTAARADGTMQIVAGKWPLYVFSGDSAPGDVNGEGVLGKWFAVQPNGKLLKPTAAATPTTPASSTPTMNTSTGSGYGY